MFKTSDTAGEYGWLILGDACSRVIDVYGLKSKSGVDVLAKVQKHFRKYKIPLPGLRFGFDTDSAIAKFREFVDYIEEQTGRPCALSAPGEQWQNGAETAVRKLKYAVKCYMKERSRTTSMSSV